MALDAIIFDVDGTLVDSNQLHVEAFVQAFSQQGYKVEKDRIEVEIGKGGDTLVPAILGKSADARHGDAIRKAEPVEFTKLAKARGITAFPGARELLQAVRRRGLLTVIATSSGKAQLEPIETYSGLKFDELADLVITADDATTSKPAPDLVVAAVKKSKLSPAQCGMIGDRVYDIQAAKLAGVACLGLLCGGNTAEDLFAAGARGVFDDPAAVLSQLDTALELLSPGKSHLTTGIMERLMAEALAAARHGMAAGEVPIGCVIARGDGTVIARGWNEFNKTRNKTDHAEMVTFARSAGKIPDDAKDVILVSTLEPCVMCTGAAMESAVDTIVFGLRAPADAGTSRVSPPRSPDVQMPRIIGDVLADESRGLFKQWYSKNSGSPQAAYVQQLLKLHGQ